MTYDTDPNRWSESISDAPDVLRAPFAAARNEGPSDLQMKALALKLAALSAGTAVAASAATAKAAASTTAGGAAATSAASFSIAKVAVSVALFGATITGAVVWQGKSVVREGSRPQVPIQQPAQVTGQQPVNPLDAPTRTLPAAPSERPHAADSAPSAPGSSALQPIAPVAEQASRPGEGDSLAPAAASAPAVAATPSEARPSRDVPDAANVRKVAPSRERAAGSANGAADSAPRVGRAAQPQAGTTEVDLLRRARTALASRPREAFELTQEHRHKFPGGMFTQERDALAIEALVRAGEMDTARSLAERFVREHPSSPHAHRFRETMGL